MSDLWKWVPGRQEECTYQKKKLWLFGSKLVGLFTDGYLIKYPPNAKLPKHTDPVELWKHYRINIELKGKGEFGIKGKCFRFWRIAAFRPDHCEHWMNNGPTERLVFSIGFACFWK